MSQTLFDRQISHGRSRLSYNNPKGRGRQSPLKMSSGQLVADLNWINQNQASGAGNFYHGGPGYHQENIFDAEYNRAVARTLYVESTVNVVNTRSKSSYAKVKPGQMNLFNAKDLKKMGIKAPQ